MATNTYTPNGKVQTLADAKGNTTTYAYDGFDRLSKTIYPSSASDYEQLTYDANSNITAKRLRSAASIGYAYDALNRLTNTYLPSQPSNANATYTYDLVGNLLTAVNGNGVYSTGDTYTYDALGRKTSETSQLNGAGSIAKTMTYYANGWRKTLAWPDGLVINYAYDTVGEVIGIGEIPPGGSAASLASYYYDDLGERTGRYYVNGTHSTYGYDSASHLTSLSLVTGTTTINTTTLAGYSPANEIGSRANTSDAYAWTQGASAGKSYVTDANNRYTNVAGGSLSYDALGNLTGYGGASYSYSSENDLTGSGSAAYYNDGLHRMVYGTAAATRFDYDGSQLIGEYDSSNNLLRRYVFGAGADEPIVWYEGSGTSAKRFQDSDERGSITRVTDISGNPIAVNSYDEYGNPGASNTGRFQFTGQAYLPEVGLYDYKARMYSPSLGRFMQTDPIGYQDGPNWYNYAHSDPINEIDPNGLACTQVGDYPPQCNQKSSTDLSFSILTVSVFGVGKRAETAGRIIFTLAAYTPQDRCAQKATPPRNGSAPFYVDASQLQSIAQAKFLQHSFSLSPSGNPQSTFGGVMTSGSRVASGAAFLISTRDAVSAGGLNSRITGDLGVTVGRDIYSSLPSTDYMTVIVGPTTGISDGLPERPVVSIYPGC